MNEKKKEKITCQECDVDFEIKLRNSDTSCKDLWENS